MDSVINDTIKVEGNAYESMFPYKELSHDEFLMMENVAHGRKYEVKGSDVGHSLFRKHILCRYQGYVMIDSVGSSVMQSAEYKSHKRRFQLEILNIKN